MKTWSIFLPAWMTRLLKKPSGLEIEHVRSAPYIRPVNEFLRNFIQSSQPRVEFSADDFKTDTVPLLSAFQGLNYETIRLRLRVISSLNPVMNLKPEEGTIRGKTNLLGVMYDFKIRSIFAPKGQSVVLEKIEVTPESIPGEGKQ